MLTCPRCGESGLTVGEADHEAPSLLVVAEENQSHHGYEAACWCGWEAWEPTEEGLRDAVESARNALAPRREEFARARQEAEDLRRTKQVRAREQEAARAAEGPRPQKEETMGKGGDIREISRAYLEKAREAADKRRFDLEYLVAEKKLEELTSIGKEIGVVNPSAWAKRLIEKEGKEAPKGQRGGGRRKRPAQVEDEVNALLDALPPLKGRETPRSTDEEGNFRPPAVPPEAPKPIIAAPRGGGGFCPITHPLERLRVAVMGLPTGDRFSLSLEARQAFDTLAEALSEHERLEAA